MVCKTSDVYLNGCVLTGERAIQGDCYPSELLLLKPELHTPSLACPPECCEAATVFALLVHAEWQYTQLHPGGNKDTRPRRGRAWTVV